MSRTHSKPQTAHKRIRLGVERLESRDVPAFFTGAEVVVGADAAGPPVVQLIDPSTQVVQSEFLAFDPTFYGGVRVAVGDVTGDGYPDLVVAAGRGGGPQVNVYDGRTGAVLASFFAYDPGFSGGVYVAVGDVNGDGQDEIITSPGIGGGPQVKVFDPTGMELASFLAYDPSFRGGVRVAAGHLDNSGVADIITAPGTGGGPDVRVFHLTLPPLLGGFSQVRNFFAFDPSFTGGAYVAAGDVNGDGVDDIITGAGSGGGPQVNVFDSTSGIRLASFFAFDPSFRGGVRVAAADLTGDGSADVITGAGKGGGPQVNVYSLPSTTPLAGFWGLAANQTVGVQVAGSAQPINTPSTPDAVSSAYAQFQAAQAAQAAAAAAAAAAATTTHNIPPPFTIFPIIDGSFYDPYGTLPDSDF